jgi:hypothetical protein
MPASTQPHRTWDGSPETEADTRFFDLRASGYTGWIDQDGHAATEPTATDGSA